MFAQITWVLGTHILARSWFREDSDAGIEADSPAVPWTTLQNVSVLTAIETDRSSVSPPLPSHSLQPAGVYHLATEFQGS